MFTAAMQASLPPQKSRVYGFTLIEMTVVAALFVIVFSAIWQTFGNASAVISASLWETDLDTALRKVVVRLAEELVDSGLDTDGTDYVTSHPATATTTLPFITVQKRVALTGDPAADWSTPITFALGASPGETAGNSIDDDGDGLIDEQCLIRTQDAVSRMVADGVTGFSVSRNAGENLITIQLSMSRPSNPGMTPLSRTVSTTMAFRNRN